MAKTVYVDGMRVFKPHANAPDFVKGTLLITVNDLIVFAKANEQYMRDYKGAKQLPCQILSNDNGDLSITLDTFKPSNQDGGSEPQGAPPSGGDVGSELPF
jgi:hypothetical protein